MIKLIIAEDEKIARESIKKLLETYFSHEITVIYECDNGEDAVEKTLSLRPDAILPDIHMPKKDGLSAAKSIKFYMEDCEIIIITANSQFEYAKEAIKLKVEDFLVKPYSVKSFKETISKLIEKLKKNQLQKEEKKELENHFDKVKVIAEKDFVLEIIKNR